MAIIANVIFVVSLFIVQNNAEDERLTYTPKNFCLRLTTNDTALLQWVEPVTIRAEIRGYTIYYTRNAELPLEEWAQLTIGTYPMTTIRNIKLGQIYHFRIQVNTLGLAQPEPLSDIYDFPMLNRTRSCYDYTETSTITSLNILRAAATSDSSVEVWWNFNYDPHHVTGFQIFYGKNDSEQFFNETVGLTQSVELFNLEKFAVYRIVVAAVTKSGLDYYSQEVTIEVNTTQVPLNVKVYNITADSMHLKWSPPTNLQPIKYKIAYDAVKEFVDSFSLRQRYQVEKIEVLIDSAMTSYKLTNLIPYTNYNINISAIPVDHSYRPSTKIIAKTEKAAPKPMVKPDFYGIMSGGRVKVLLPQASEEYGPISYYYVIIVPVLEGEVNLPSSIYRTEELLQNEWDQGEDIDAPYIAAKLSKIPYAFIMGDGSAEQGGFKNYKLDPRKKYKVFIRAVVRTPQKELFTDSPYSSYFSLDMSNQN